jgi:hypothetical protein
MIGAETITRKAIHQADIDGRGIASQYLDGYRRRP